MHSTGVSAGPLWENFAGITATAGEEILPKQWYCSPKDRWACIRLAVYIVAAWPADRLALGCSSHYSQSKSNPIPGTRHVHRGATLKSTARISIKPVVEVMRILLHESPDDTPWARYLGSLVWRSQLQARLTTRATAASAGSLTHGDMHVSDTCCTAVHVNRLFSSHQLAIQTACEFRDCHVVKPSCSTFHRGSADIVP